MILVYIASPYTIGDQAVNVKRQMDTFEALANLGFCPLAPLLTHYQHILHPRPYSSWIDITLEYVRHSDVVLRLPGESKGADGEVAEAESSGIPVVFSIEELVKIYGDQDAQLPR